MKCLYLLLSLAIIPFLSNAQASATTDTAKTAPRKIFTAIEQEPSYPGGVAAFQKFIVHNLKYPKVASLLGLKGKVYVSFIIETDGSVTNVRPTSCTGAGCESEAVRVISISPQWHPGMQEGRPVRVAYTVPIEFYFQDDWGKTRMRKLRNSDLGFLFYIKNKVYSIDEAQIIMGKSFDPDQIASVEPCSDPQYTVSDKKETYLVVMKN